MIISASRRTDIPAFYGQWFINRVREGFCTVPNPFNRRQVAQVSLLPQDVEVIVFWTRHPRPFLPYLDELDRRGFRYYFQYTLLGYPRQLDTRGPSREAALATFCELSERLGPERMIWRYDPIMFGPFMGAHEHAENYAQIAAALRGRTFRSVISLMDVYPKIRKRVMAHAALEPDWAALMPILADTAVRNGMRIQSCAEEIDLTGYGIQPGSCVDAEYIEATFGLEVGQQKDPGQRAACRCAVSKDIGMYESCVFGCLYCYATRSFERARQNFERHDPHSPALIAQ